MSYEAKMITLKSSDDVSFEVEEAIAIESQTIKHMIQDDCTKTTIPLPKLTANILAMVIEYCKKHNVRSDEGAEDHDLKRFDADFVKVDKDVLYELALAARYLNIKSLSDLTAEEMADRMIDMATDMRVEELREFFKVVIRKEHAWACLGKENDITPQEEAAIRKKIASCVSSVFC